MQLHQSLLKIDDIYANLISKTCLRLLNMCGTVAFNVKVYVRCATFLINFTVVCSRSLTHHKHSSVSTTDVIVSMSWQLVHTKYRRKRINIDGDSHKNMSKKLKSTVFIYPNWNRISRRRLHIFVC